MTWALRQIVTVIVIVLDPRILVAFERAMQGHDFTLTGLIEAWNCFRAGWIWRGEP